METQTAFRIRPLSGDVAAAARDTRTDFLGNPLVVLRDGGTHQCRVCLRLSRPDEGVILLAHKPFETSQPYAETGPIFVHEHACAPYNEPHLYPAEFPHSAVVLRGYSSDDRIVDAQAVGRIRTVESAIAGMFETAEVAYIHARNLGYGCYMFRIDRA